MLGGVKSSIFGGRRKPSDDAGRSQTRAPLFGQDSSLQIETPPGYNSARHYSHTAGQSAMRMGRDRTVTHQSDATSGMQTFAAPGFLSATAPFRTLQNDPSYSSRLYEKTSPAHIPRSTPGNPEIVKQESNHLPDSRISSSPAIGEGHYYDPRHYPSEQDALPNPPSRLPGLKLPSTASQGNRGNLAPATSRQSRLGLVEDSTTLGHARSQEFVSSSRNTSEPPEFADDEQGSALMMVFHDRKKDKRLIEEQVRPFHNLMFSQIIDWRM